MLTCSSFGFDINLFKVCILISFIIYFNNIWKDFELKNKKKSKKRMSHCLKNVQCTNILSTKLSIMKMARNLKMATKINTAARV